MRPGEVNELRDLCARWAQASEVHLEEGSPLFLVRSKKLFNQGCSAVKSRIDGRKSVGADEGNDPAALPAQMIDSLNQCIHGHFVLVMAVLLDRAAPSESPSSMMSTALRFLPAADEIF